MTNTTRQSRPRTIRASLTAMAYTAPLDPHSEDLLHQAISWSHRHFKLKPAPGTVFRRALALYASHLKTLKEVQPELSALQAAGRGSK